MTTRYRIHLSMQYKFDQPVAAGRQLLRLSPASLPGLQQVVSRRVTIRPKARERRSFTDFFGTQVVEVVLPTGQTEINYDMLAEVICTGESDSFDLSAPLQDLAGQIAAVTSLAGGSPHHFLVPSPRVPLVRDIADFAREVTLGAVTAREAVVALGLALHEALAFDDQATDVDTPIDIAFGGRHGVCQDFSQIMISGLRSLGIPAAYVSGFLRTLPPPGQKKLQGADAMHAWVRAWTGGEAGWVDYDPTNACFANRDHVVIGYGRDYSDAAPVVGMLRMGGAQTSGHAVDVEEI